MTSYDAVPSFVFSSSHSHDCVPSTVGMTVGGDLGAAAATSTPRSSVEPSDSSSLGRSHSACQTQPMQSTQELLSLFECPVCYEYILPPAFQCCQGHPICANCKRKVTHCPSCREELGNIRCLMMEKVGDTLHFPCKYALQGCSLMLHRSRKAAHETEQCAYKLFECPYRFIDNCLEWYGNAEKVVDHLTLVHLENFKREHGNLTPFVGDVFPFVPYVHVIDYAADNTTSWMWTALQACHGAMFVVNLYYVHNALTNVHFVTVRLVDTMAAAKKYTYCVRLEGPNGELSYRGRCHSLHEDVKEVYENRDCLQFDNITASKFKSELTVDGQRQPVLKLCIKIYGPDSGMTTGDFEEMDC